MQTGMKFIFKGGTSLMLLLEHPLRLSTDIDIIVDPGTDVDRYIEAAGNIFPFLRREEDFRIGKNNIVVSGGAWKGPDIMFDSFCSEIRKVYPDAVIRRPVFEPVVGNVILRLIYEGRRKEDFWDVLKEKFSDYLYMNNNNDYYRLS